MSGPGLRQLHSHRSIHDAAYGEADEITTALKEFVQTGKEQASIATVRVLIEHWHTRTLRHAAEEEEGFYKEVATEHPEHVQDIAVLTRDHDLMRHLVAEIEALAKNEGSMRLILVRFQMLLWLVEQHSREEERRLLTAEDGGNRS